MGQWYKKSLTIKYNKKIEGRDASMEELAYIYTVYLEKVQRDCGAIIVCMKYEFDSNGIYHGHGIIEFPKCIKYANFRYFGMHVYMSDISDLEGWEKYINKSPARTPDEIFQAEKDWSLWCNGTQKVDLE